MQSPNLLVHFDGSKPLVLTCDASPYGVGTVLSHWQEDGSKRPIAFASRTLAPKKCSQLDKEVLAIIFGMKHFHQYIYGRSFIIISDQKPLKHLFSESKATHAMASARIQRRALLWVHLSIVSSTKQGKRTQTQMHWAISLRMVFPQMYRHLQRQFNWWNCLQQPLFQQGRSASRQSVTHCWPKLNSMYKRVGLPRKSPH